MNIRARGASCYCSVGQSCPTLCDPVGCSTPGFGVPHCLPEFAQTHVYWVGDAIQPLSSPSPVLSLSHHQSLFQWGAWGTLDPQIWGLPTQGSMITLSIVGVGNSLAVQWSGLCTLTEECASSIPGPAWGWEKVDIHIMGGGIGQEGVLWTSGNGVQNFLCLPAS